MRRLLMIPLALVCLCATLRDLRAEPPAPDPRFLHAADQTALDGEEKVEADLRLYDLDQRVFQLSDHVEVAGARFAPFEPHGVILIFGAYWCEPCKGLMAALHQARERIAAAGMKIIYVHVNDIRVDDQELDLPALREKARAMAAHNDYAGVRVVFGDRLLAQRWLATEDVSLPGVVVLHQDGTIATRFQGTNGDASPILTALD